MRRSKLGWSMWAVVVVATAMPWTGEVVLGATFSDQPRPATGTALGPLIPRRLLFAAADRTGVQLSPDGKQLAWLAPVAGVPNVWVAPMENMEAARPVTHDTTGGIGEFFWAYTGSDILFMQSKRGDEDFRLYAVDLQTGRETDLTPFDSIVGPDGKPATLPNGAPLRPRAHVVDVSYKQPGQVLIGLNNRNPQFHDLYRVDIKSGQLTLVQQNEGFSGFLTDDDYLVRLAMRPTDNGGSEMLRPDGKPGPSGYEAWQPFQRVEMEDALATNPVGFDRTGTVLYLIDGRGRDTAAVVSLDLPTGRSRVLAEDARADAVGALIHPTSKAVQAVEFRAGRQEWRVLDPAIAGDFEAIRAIGPGEIGIVGRSLDDARWLVSLSPSDGPTRWYSYERRGKSSRLLLGDRAGLERAELRPMRAVVIRARDGLEMTGYLTLPGGVAENDTGRPARPSPMVLTVRSDPWAREVWGLNAEHQWLANRGYAVLSVNFRGSTGLGKRFAGAGDRQWGGAMQDDLIDAVGWAVAEGVADPSRVAIFGGSYGGYAALLGLSLTPEVFACGVSIVGPTNLVTLLGTVPTYWQPMVDMFVRRVGDHRTDAGRAFLATRSPLGAADHIKRPLLIGHGGNDPRVPRAEIDQLIQAARKNGAPVTLAEYGDEAHGFARPENRLSFYAIAEAFLAKHLGGRFEAIGEDFRGSSVTVPVGAEEVPGAEGAPR